MKLFLAGLLSMIMSPVFARQLDTYSCQQWDTKNEVYLQKTMLLIQQSPWVDDTTGYDSQAQFRVLIYDGPRGVAEINVTGTARSADVYFRFESSSDSENKIGISTYLDEAEDTEVSLNGKKIGDFYCRFL